MEILLPIAGVEINIFFLLAIGLIVGFLSGLLGIGGGVLLTPLLMMLGIPSLVAVASGLNQVVAVSVAGTYIHYRLGHVDLKMGIFLLLGSTIGGGMGVQVVKKLNDLDLAEEGIRILYIVVLGIIGLVMLGESLKTIFFPRKKDREKKRKKSNHWRCKWPLVLYFPHAGRKISFPLLILLGLGIGVFSGIMGVGGGFILTPALIYLFKVPTVVAVGTGLFQIIFTSLWVTAQHIVINRSVDLFLVVILFLSSTVGVQLGARLTKKINPAQIRLLLSLVVLATMGRFLHRLLAPSAHPSLPPPSFIKTPAWGKWMVFLSQEKPLLYLTLCLGVALLAGMMVTFLFKGKKMNKKEENKI